MSMFVSILENEGILVVNMEQVLHINYVSNIEEKQCYVNVVYVNDQKGLTVRGRDAMIFIQDLTEWCLANTSKQ